MNVSVDIAIHLITYNKNYSSILFGINGQSVKIAWSNIWVVSGKIRWSVQSLHCTISESGSIAILIKKKVVKQWRAAIEKKSVEKY